MSAYLLTFDSTHDGIATRSALRGRFKCVILPTPRELSASCGTSLRIEGVTFAEVQAELAQLGLTDGRTHCYQIDTTQGTIYQPLPLC